MTNYRRGVFYKEWKIAELTYGLHFVDGDFVGVLQPGTHRFYCFRHDHQVDVVSLTQPFLNHAKFDEIVLSGKLADLAEVLEIGDDQRGIVWVNGRYDRILAPGTYAYWKKLERVQVEIVDTSSVMFAHKQLSTIANSINGTQMLERQTVPPEHVGLLYYDEQYARTLLPGTYVFWKNAATVKVERFSMREQLVEIIGQEMMTGDKVTLRMNACFGYKISDARKMSESIENVHQYLHRETQIALRNVIGRRELEQFLNDRNEIATEAEQMLRERTGELGITVTSFGIRDVILPGEMKEMFNKVTAAQKSAEANQILRREETAAMRSQANTAKLLENNPTLMRLRELEVLEKIAESGKLQVIVGEKGLTERVVNML